MSQKKNRHSIVIPVFNEVQGIRNLLNTVLKDVAQEIQKMEDSLELIFVDDGSTDGSRELLKEVYTEWVSGAGVTKDYPLVQIKVIFLSRNFGHQLAITAGIDFASGDTVTVMDADLQDPPQVVLEMIQKFYAGADVVFARREQRQGETLFKKLTAALFYRILKSNTRLEIPLDTGDFRLMSRRAVNALKQMPEQHRFVRGMASWVGFNQTSVLYKRNSRTVGMSKYPFSKMFKLAWDAFTGFSLAPLRIATYTGLFAACGGLAMAIWALYVRFFTTHSVQGWTSLMIAVTFLGGVQLFSIGILGEYVGRIFEESKKRPLYIVEETLS